jgi:Helix-turn-helix domain
MADDRKKAFTADKFNWLDCVQNDHSLKPAALNVAYAIMKHVNSETLTAWLSDETLVDITGISRAQVQRHRESLKEAGWLTWKRTPGENHYTPLFDRVKAGLDDILAKREKRKELRKTRRRVVGGTPDASPARQPDASPVRQPDASPVRHIHLQSNTFTLTLNTIHRTACAVDASDRDCSPPALPEESKESGNTRSSNEDRYPRTYRQSPAEAARAWSELNRLDGWPPDWSREEMTHWHALLRNGHAADDIVDVAERFLRKTPEGDVPSREDFLACFENVMAEINSATPAAWTA